MEQIVYLNGSLLPQSQAKISPFDLGFLYGYGLFETMRAYSGRIFRLEKHLERLSRSAKLLGLPLNAFDLKKACHDTLQANKLKDARIRLTVSMGEGEAIPALPKHPRPTVLVTAARYVPLADEAYRKGYRVVVSTIDRDSQSPLSRLKSANYLNNILARIEDKAAGADEAILLNERGFLCEGSASNIFMISKGNLITPGEESGCLPGITRQVVLELAQGLGIGTSEREVRLEELLHADEAFLTNSIMELMPLAEVNGQRIGRGKVTERLMLAYREAVVRETKKGLKPLAKPRKKSP
jgi:branched-chain amino acid aminotransferase group I